MTDIHSHLLFGIDDGAKSIEESMEMVKTAIDNGYTDIVCSSHFFTGKFENQNYEVNFNRLKEKIAEEGLDIKIYRGNEVDMDPDIFTKLDMINTINSGKYILIELKSKIIYQACVNFIKKLQSMGYIPILAHVERYPHLSTKEIISLYNMGVIIQMNIHTILHMSGTVKELLERRYIEVIGTDAHSTGRRSYDVRGCLEKLRKIVGEDYFKTLTEINPEKIINNEKIEKGEWHEKKNTGNIFITLWNSLFSGNVSQ